MRLFIAILLSEQMKQALVQCQEELVRQAEFARPTDWENLHLTLAFIGETQRPDDVRAAMEAVAIQPMKLTLAGCGRFRGDGGDLYWAGLCDQPALSRMAQSLARELRARGFVTEERPFRAHITLARQVRAKEKISLTLAPVSMTAGKISLMESRREGGKLIYREIDSKSGG